MHVHNICVCFSPSIGAPDEERKNREAFSSGVAEYRDLRVTPQRPQPHLGQSFLPLLNERTKQHTQLRVAATYRLSDLLLAKTADRLPRSLSPSHARTNSTPSVVAATQRVCEHSAGRSARRPEKNTGSLFS